MGEESKHYHHGDLKSALIKEALRLLEEQGLSALSLRSIAQNVGVSHMAPYSHFKNKTELFQSVAAHGFNLLASNMQSLNNQQAPQALILAYGAQYIEFALAHPSLYRLMQSQVQPKELETSKVSSELKTACKRPFVLLFDACKQLETNKQQQTLRAQGAWGTVHGLASLLIDGQLAIPDGMTIQAFLSATSGIKF